jgi:transcriptional regulator GlxA family with amidase domain
MPPESGMIDYMRTKAANEVQPHAVAVVVCDGVALFELGVACDVFGDDHDGPPLYTVSVCGAAASVTTDAGFAMEVPNGLDAMRAARTVIVLPTELPDQVPLAVLDALREARSRGARIMSLCTGAMILAAAGMLDGHAATTHWSECAELALRYPRVSVDPRVLYVDEGDLLTSAGSAASIDLCLHVVRRDYGAEVAARFARSLVVPLYRDGGQAQYIESPMPAPGDDLFTGTVSWLQAHLGEDITVAELAARSAMSARTFARRFVASTGTTPYQWVARERVRLAQRLLETTGLPVEVIARDCGLGSAANLRKQFGRALATSPQAYRRAFAGSAG